MDYQNILVHLDASKAMSQRVEAALYVSKRFNARLTGLFNVFQPAVEPLSMITKPPEYRYASEMLRAEYQEAEESMFRKALARTGIDGDWNFSRLPPNLVMPRAARLADLVIAGQYDQDDRESFIADQFIENLILSCGRPVLVVPYAGRFPEIGGTVCVAWDGSREASRAVHDALPFLVQARKVVVFSINASSAEIDAPRIDGSQIAAAVAQHGANVVIEEIDGVRDISNGNLLLSRAADFGADMIVMGCYGHARWRELFLGGVTRTILKSMTVPVLMSH
ncbi:universal stress protein [Bordetella sp. FB-8]|uniref:universal stress protein n=1 Tax=Bordetella sp. FB-8 TaxID=1159870 RepID=UPI00037A9A5C|nr:universal stress protein [Bordetella sp. FB-8]